MKNAVEVGSVAVIYEYIPCFIKRAAIQKLMQGGGYIDTQTAW
jgi:hypothetical protein